MSSRKNYLLHIFALLMIAINVFSFAAILTYSNKRENDQIVLPNMKTNPDFIGNIVTNNMSDIPNMDIWDLTINVSRLITLYDFGYLTINDSYSIIKKDNLTLPIFRFVFPNIWTSNLVDIKGFSMWDKDNLPLNASQVYLEQKNDQYSFYAVTLNPAIGSSNDSLYKVNILATLLRPYNVTEFIDENTYYRNGVIFNATEVPILTKGIRKCQTSFAKPANGGFINNKVFPSDATIGSALIIFTELNNVPAFNFTKWTTLDYSTYPYRIQIGSYLGLYPPTEALMYKRIITLENWYWAKVHEEITIKNFGIAPEEIIVDPMNEVKYDVFALTRFSIFVDNAENYVAYDENGELRAPEGSNLVAQNKLFIYLHVPLFGGDSQKVNLDYLLKLEDILDYEKTEYILNTRGMPKCEFHVRNFELTIIFPQGAKFQYVTFGGNPVDYTEKLTGVFFKIGFRKSITFTATNITTNHNIIVNAGYYMADLAYFIQPLIYSLIIFVACLLYVGARVLRKEVIEKVVVKPEVREEIPVELIQKFVEQYEEKTALQIRITNLDEDRRRKKIKQIEFDKQRKILETKMRELVLSLDTTKRQLKEEGRKYYDAIQKIEINEEKRISVEKNIIDLRIRYIREKQISKEAYLRILRDYQNQIEKFERDIDKEIINLRLLVEHEAREK